MNRVINKNACAYREIYEILKIFPEELVKKIPEEKIKFFYNNMDRNYNYVVTKENFEQTQMLEETAAIFTILFRDYWATPEQKEKILGFQKNAQRQIEKEAREKYNPENIFKNQTISTAPIQNEPVVAEKAMIEYKETIFIRIKKWFKNIFKK